MIYFLLRELNKEEYKKKKKKKKKIEHGYVTGNSFFTYKIMK